MPGFHWEELSEKLNDLLQNDPQLAPYALKARVYEDGFVQIQGIVDVLEEKNQAEQLMFKVPGVQRVENNITVCTDGAINDEDVAFEVGEELHANPAVPDTIGIQVHGGEVHLVGTVSNREEADQAIETASKARGVVEVYSDLHLNVEQDDVSITNAVQAALLAEPTLIPGRVHALTDHGVVRLWGGLSEGQAKLAMEIAARVPGVREVHNGFINDRVELDDQVVITAMDSISTNPYLNELPISVEMIDGKVVLSGTVDTLEAKRDLEAIIGQIVEQTHIGKNSIENKVRLKPREENESV